MNPNFLEFEQPIADLEAKIEELRLVGSGSEVNISEEVAKLQEKSISLTENIFSNLSAWQISQLSRHPKRPYMLDYIKRIFADFDELHGANVDVYLTVSEFLALVGLVVGAPATLVLYVVVMSAVTSSAQLTRGAKLAFHTMHVLVLAALLVLFWIAGGSDLLGCGLFICVGPVTREQIEAQPFVMI